MGKPTFLVRQDSHALASLLRLGALSPYWLTNVSSSAILELECWAHSVCPGQRCKRRLVGWWRLSRKKCMRYCLGNHSCRRHSSFPSLELVTTSSFSRDLAYHVHPSPWQPYRTSGYMYASTCCAIVPKNGIKNSNTNTTSLATSPSSRCMSIPHMWLSSGAVGS